MKKFTLLSLLFLSVFGCIYAQNASLVLFTEQGERFEFVLNGLLQNNTPQTNVRVTGLIAENYALKVMFEDRGIPDLDVGYLGTPLGYETTYKIKRNNQGRMVLRMVSSTPLPMNPAPVPVLPAQQVVVFNPAAPTWNGGFINAGVTVGGVTVNTGISITDNPAGMMTPPFPGNPNPNFPPQPTPPPVIVYVPGYQGYIGCPMPMDPNAFAMAKSSIASKTFEDTRMTVARQILANNCLTSAQVREMMDLFTFESTKLDFAKYCYNRTYDMQNYYIVNDAFTFESSIEDLNVYIAAQPQPQMMAGVAYPNPMPAPDPYYQGGFQGGQQGGFQGGQQGGFQGGQQGGFQGGQQGGFQGGQQGGFQGGQQGGFQGGQQGGFQGGQQGGFQGGQQGGFYNTGNTGSGLPGTGMGRCAFPMGDGEFMTLKNAINKQSFEDSKLTIMKQALSSGCVRASQIKDLMGLFTYEKNKLEVAKYCYNFVYDPNNYFQVNDGFTYKSSIDELNKFIQYRK